MGINLLTFNQKTVTPKDDALIQQFALGQDGFFYGGVVTYTGGNTLHFASGEGVICGREFVLEDTDVSAALPASGTLLGQVYIHIDLSNADTPIELICETAAELTELTKDENMNVNNGEYDLQLCTFTATTSAITDLSSKVTYIKKGGAGSNENLATVEESDTSSQAYVTGQHLVYDDTYCEVIDTIAQDDPFVVYPDAGANIKPAKVGDEITALNQNLTTRWNAITDRLEVLKNGTWVQSIRTFVNSLAVFVNGLFNVDVTQTYTPFNNYGVVPFTVSGGALQLNIDATAVDNGATFVTDDIIDFSNYATITVKSNYGTKAVDVSGYSGTGYLALTVYRDGSAIGHLYYGIVSAKQNMLFEPSNIINNLAKDFSLSTSGVVSITEITIE